MTGIEALRNVLLRMRWNDQGGYPGRLNGKWDFISTGLPHTSPEELDALFALAGLVPDEIVSLGSCKDCANAKNGREQGYATKECISCSRPRMSNFVPAKKLVRT